MTLVCTVSAGTARAKVGVDAELGVGAGHDNALFRLATVIPANATTEDWFWEWRPRFALTLDPSMSQRLELRYDGTFRDFRIAENGRAHAHAFRAGYGFDLTPGFSLQALASGAVDIPTAVDGGYHTGTAALGTVWHVTTRTDLGVDFEAQWLDSPVIRGWFEGVTVRGEWRTSRVELGARLQGFTDGAGWRQVAGLLSAAARFDLLRLEANGGVATVNDGRWVLFGGAVGLELSSEWALAVRYDGRYEAYGSALTPIVGHDVGVAVHWAWESTGTGAASLLEAVRDREAMPVGPPGVELTISVSATSRTVALAGDFNGWDPAATPLSSVAPGVWRMRVQLPPGHYAFQVVVDGQPCTPAGAKTYVDDGFGGQNASLWVMAEVSAETLSCGP